MMISIPERLTAALFLGSLFSIFSGYAQIDPNTNAVMRTVLPVDPPAFHPAETPSVSGFQCDPTRFYGITDKGAIVEMTFQGGSVVVTSTALSSSGLSVAFCSNLNGGLFSPTFYVTGTQISAYYNGSAWSQIPAGGINNGGSGNFLYYMKYNNGFDVVRYNGSTYNSIWSTTKSAGVADLSADTSGRVYFTTRSITSATMTDSLIILSSGGQVLNQFPLVYDSNHAYGSFLSGGIYYIGFGATHLAHPNTLLPITLGTGTITVGNPIPMPAIVFSDLAGCDGEQMTVSVAETLPACQLYFSSLNAEARMLFVNPGRRKLFVSDLTGRVLKKEEVTEAAHTLHLTGMPPGIYFIIVTDDERALLRRKLVVW